MNTFINFIKKFLIKREIKVKIKALRIIKILLLLALNFSIRF